MDEIMKLYIKINEYKANYEKAKKDRIELVETIEDLDKRISELEDAGKELKDNHIRYLENKQDLKKHIKDMICIVIFGILISTLVNIITKDFSMYLHQILYLLIFNGAIHLGPYIIIRKKGPKIKKVTLEDVSNYEKEYNELIQTRLSEGQKYRSVREKEVLTEKLYKGIEKSLNGEIIRMEIYGEDHLNRPQINTFDIYHNIKVDYSFYEETTEDKKKILDEKLKEYLAIKVANSYYKAFDIDVLKELTTKELITMLLDRIPTNEQNEILENIIHAILNFSGNIQSYSVVWFQEEDENLVTLPEVIFDEEGKWTELKTHKNTDYKLIFDTVYNTFLNDVMKETNNKTKVRK